MNRITTIICATVLALVVGCSPYNFSLQKETGWEIEGKKTINHDNVLVEANNLLVLEPQSGAFIRCVQLTDGIFNTEMKIFNRSSDDAGDAVRMRFRSTPYDDTVLASTHGFEIEIMHDRATVFENGKATVIPVDMPEAGEPFRVVVKQHGQFIEATVACMFLGRYETETPTTQWVAIETRAGHRVEVRDPTFRPIRDDFTPEPEDFFGSLFD